MLTLFSTGEDFFQRDHVRILQASEAKFSLALQNAVRFSDVENDATVDFLTGLLNSRSLFQRLEEKLQGCRAAGQGLAVVVCDLNGFKAVNDLEGHLVGNQLLTHFGTQLQTYSRTCDTVARIGGDEFALLLPVGNASLGPESLSWLSKALADAGRQAGVKAAVSISIGTAYFPGDGDSAEDLLAAADRRMYRDKGEQKKGVISVTAGMVRQQEVMVA